MGLGARNLGLGLQVQGQGVGTRVWSLEIGVWVPRTQALVPTNAGVLDQGTGLCVEVLVPATRDTGLGA
ncbi:hypothetical protein NL676_014481 [Syzygium grande]|nr:hypothetical protein NL676_014481 [Syzygium grande]